jgi:hypothetical protein
MASLESIEAALAAQSVNGGVTPTPSAPNIGKDLFAGTVAGLGQSSLLTRHASDELNRVCCSSGNDWPTCGSSTFSFDEGELVLTLGLLSCAPSGSLVRHCQSPSTILGRLLVDVQLRK